MHTSTISENAQLMEYSGKVLAHRPGVPVRTRPGTRLHPDGAGRLNTFLPFEIPERADGLRNTVKKNR